MRNPNQHQDLKDSYAHTNRASAVDQGLSQVRFAVFEQAKVDFLGRAVGLFLICSMLPCDPKSFITHVSHIYVVGHMSNTKVVQEGSRSKSLDPLGFSQ